VDFASFCLSLPPEFKLTSRADKLILREAFSNQWPEVIRNRDKRGFGAPLDKWLDRDTVKTLQKNIWESGTAKIYSVLPREKIRAVPENDARKNWLLLSLALWAEKHSFEN
jgi:asparagine synthase (glutamine-hydrolysing)